MSKQTRSRKAPSSPEASARPAPGLPAPRAGRPVRTEAERLATLYALCVLDTPAEQVFDDLVDLAAMIAGTPVALVSLIDAERQWFKAVVGLDVCSTGRDIAFCDHVIRTELELEVPDARLDARFMHNPMVTDDPHIVFYAGFPLMMPDGTVPGTLCAIGYEPQRLTEQQKSAMRVLARQVVVQLGLRAGNAEQAREIERRKRAEEAARNARFEFEQLAEHSSDIVARYRIEGEVTYVNPAVTTILGHPVAEVVGSSAAGFVLPEYAETFAEARRTAAAGGTAVITVQAANAVGEPRWLELTVTPVPNPDGTIEQLQSAGRDVHDRMEKTRALIDSEFRFRSVYHDSPVGIMLADAQGLITEVNPAMCRLLDLPEAEIVGRRRDSFAPPEDAEPSAAGWFRQQARIGDTIEMERRFVRSDGEIRWAWISVAAVEGTDGKVWSLAHIQDSTARKAAEQALHDSEANLAAIAAVVRRIGSGEDPRQTIVEAAQEIGGTGTANLVELQDDDLMVITASAGPFLGQSMRIDEATVTARVWRTGEALFVPDVREHPSLKLRADQLSDVRSMLWQPILSQGVVTAILTVTWSEPIPDLSGRSARAVLLLADEAAVALEHDALLRRYETLATTDQLTGLPNRRCWDDRLAALLALSARNGTPLCLAVLDVDHFKTFNDTRGHLAGDELLAAIGTAVRTCLRTEDLVARWGGEEFAIALPGARAADAVALLERVRAVIPEGQTASVGVVEWEAGATAESLLGRADSALYRAKTEGRNRTVLAS